MDPSRRVVLVGFDGFQSLDLIGPNEVFSIASRLVPGAYSDAYAQLIHVWHAADKELQPVVADVRARLVKLGESKDVPGPPRVTPARPPRGSSRAVSRE